MPNPKTLSMGKHGSTIDAIVVPKPSIKRLLKKVPVGTWVDFDFVDVSIVQNPAQFDDGLSQEVNDSYVVNHNHVKSITARATVTVAKTTYTFSSWVSLHEGLSGADPNPPVVTPQNPVLSVHGYFRAVAIYTY